MDNFLAVITFASLVCTAGFCENGNYVAAVLCIGVFGVAGFAVNRRYERERKRQHERELRKMARQ